MKGEIEMYEIRKLGENDEQMLLKVLKEKSLDNLFLLSNLKNYGLYHPDLHFWGSFKYGKLTGVLMKYRFSYGIYDYDNADVEEFSNMLKERNDARYLIGKRPYVQAVVKNIKDLEIKKQNTYIAATLDEVVDRGLPHIPKRASSQDVDRIERFYKQSAVERSIDHLHKKGKKQKHYIIEVGSELVSTISTEAETDEHVMVGNLYTVQPYRNRGYGSSCLQHLCQDVIADKKEPCLFFNNTEEGSLYKRLGFVERDEWEMVEFI